MKKKNFGGKALAGIYSVSFSIKDRGACIRLCFSIPGLVKIKLIMFYCEACLPCTLNEYSETRFQLHLFICVCVCVLISLLTEGERKSPEGVIWSAIFQTAPLCSIAVMLLLLCCECWCSASVAFWVMLYNGKWYWMNTLTKWLFLSVVNILWCPSFTPNKRWIKDSKLGANTYCKDDAVFLYK